MSYYHCLKCGEKLKELSSHEWGILAGPFRLTCKVGRNKKINGGICTDKYKCPNCDTEWFRVEHLIIEWLAVENLVVEGKKKESEVEHDA